MLVLEQFLCSKSGDETACEDSLAVTGHHCAVIDGATAKGEILHDGATSGRAAALLLKEAVESLPERATMRQAIAAMSKRIRRYYKERGMLQYMRQSPHERLQASAAIFSRHFMEVWLVGDCQCRIDEVWHENTKEVDTLLAHVRRFVLEHAILEGSTIEELQGSDPGRAAIHPFLVRQSTFQNADPASSRYTYPVFDGFTIRPETIVRIPVPQGTQNVVLASDGYPVLEPTLHLSEKCLAESLRADPLCFRTTVSTKGLVPGNLSYDDRAFLRLDPRRST